MLKFNFLELHKPTFSLPYACLLHLRILCTARYPPRLSSCVHPARHPLLHLLSDFFAPCLITTDRPCSCILYSLQSPGPLSGPLDVHTDVRYCVCLQDSFCLCLGILSILFSLSTSFYIIVFLFVFIFQISSY